MAYSESLIVISVPFYRVSKFFLSSAIYKKLKQQHRILIVGPMCSDKKFQKEFGGDKVSFLSFEKQSYDGLMAVLYNVSEGLRRFGYYRKIRKKLGIYWQDHISKKSSILTKDGLNKENSHGYRLAAYIMGVAGRVIFLWKFLDYVIHLFYKNNEYLQLIKNQNIIVIHSANWGFQERDLAYYSRKYKFKTIFIPYSSDQIVINGHFMVEHDMFLSQGSVETDFLLEVHNVREDRICKFGMIWHRNIEAYGKSIIKETDIKVIMYAGLSDSYFPFESEMNSVDYLINKIKCGYFGNAKLIYRPSVLSKEQKKIINKKYLTNSYVDLQSIPTNIVGIYKTEKNSEETVRNSIDNYIKDIGRADILITSGPVSLGLDAVLLNIPWIMNYTDVSGALYDNEKLFRQGGETNSTPEKVLKLDVGVPYVYNLSDMAKQIKVNLDCSINRVKKEREIFEYWDYRNKFYVEDFMELINIEKSNC